VIVFEIDRVLVVLSKVNPAAPLATPESLN